MKFRFLLVFVVFSARRSGDPVDRPRVSATGRYARHKLGNASERKTWELLAARSIMKYCSKTYSASITFNQVYAGTLDHSWTFSRVAKS
jgi:hypothetical protein